MPRACLIVLLLLTACAQRPDRDPNISAYHAVSLDGSEVSLRDLRGQVVLLNVWTLWCLPCRSEMPVLERLHRAYQPAGLTLIGVNVDARGDIATVRNFIRTTGLTYRIWLDPDDGVSAHFPTPSLPATWLIGRDGRIVWNRLGMVHPDDPELGTALRNALRAEQLARASGEPDS
jgi:cytochrome c biogenesis protein CcmG, thiol:disulfide interchange protein DsbE